MQDRIAITGIGLTAPNGNNLAEFRQALLENRSGITHQDIRYMGICAAGFCHFDETKYQSRKMRKRGTRSGAISIYCANEALRDAKLDIEKVDRDAVGVFLGITEHGTAETEHEIYELHQNNLNTEFWSHHHNPRTVANSPAGEVSLNLEITGPSYTIGAACAAGNLGLIHACQMLKLKEVDLALAGGVSEGPTTFGIFAAFKSQGALGEDQDPTKATKPLDQDRNGIVISEGGAIYTLERMEDAEKRGAKIYGEIISYHVNSDASDFVLPNSERQTQCMNKAIKKAKIKANQIDIVNLHATGTQIGDIQECQSVRNIFDHCESTFINCTKGFIGHTMGAAGALELAGNIPSFSDGLIHPCRNIDNVDPKCDLKNLLKNDPISKEVNLILNNSFGMLGINSSIIVKSYNR